MNGFPFVEHQIPLKPSLFQPHKPRMNHLARNKATRKSQAGFEKPRGDPSLQSKLNLVLHHHENHSLQWSSSFQINMSNDDLSLRLTIGVKVHDQASKTNGNRNSISNYQHYLQVNFPAYPLHQH